MTKRLGRPRKNLPFKEAREVARSEQIGSRLQYLKWHDMNKPAGLPRRPDRAYKKEFISWNDFLGNNNPFPCVSKNYRSFKDARAYAQSLNMKTRKEWFELCKSGNKPEDIPKRPDLYYRDKHEWISWPNFLGVNIQDKTNTLLENENIFFIVRNPQAPQDYFFCGITSGGIPAITDFIKKINGQVIRAFYVESDFNPNTFLNDLGFEEHYENKKYYKIDNMTKLISKLSFSYRSVSSKN